MHNYTGVCLVLSNSIDWPDYCSLYIAKIWTIGFLNPGIKHFSKRGGKCSIYNAIYCIDKLLYAIENQQWPLNITCIPLFNISNTKKLMNYENSSLTSIV